MSKEFDSGLLVLCIVAFVALASVSILILSSPDDNYGFAVKSAITCTNSVASPLSVQGKISTYRLGKIYRTYADTCNSDNTVTKYYCSNNVVKYSKLPCSGTCSAGICKTTQTTTTSSLVLYSEGLSTPWTTEGSYAINPDVSSTVMASSGSRSIKADYTAGWGVLNLRSGDYWSENNLDPGKYTSLSFSVYNPGPSAKLSVQLAYSGSSTGGGSSMINQKIYDIPQGSWQKITVPVTALDVSMRPFNNIQFWLYQNNVATLYFDDIQFVGSSDVTSQYCSPNVVQSGTCNVCNSAGTAYVSKCTTGQVCTNGVCVSSPVQFCSPNVVQSGTCNVCNSAGTAYVSKCITGQVCTNGVCVSSPVQFCSPNVVQSGTCNVCNSAGTAYVSKCTTGQTCTSGVCVSSPVQFCSPNVVQSGTCNVCNSAGTAYVSKCTTGQTCTSGVCVSSPVQFCSPNVVQSGTCNVCNSAGTAYVSKCTTGQTCANGACVSSCTSTCSSLGYSCGVQSVCGVSTNCGTCTTGKTCTGGVCVASSTSGTSAAGWITGYYPTWAITHYPPDEINYHELTHIIHFSANPSMTGPTYFDPNDDELDMGGQQSMLINNAHANGVKVILSLGGVYGDGAATMDYVFADVTRRTAFVNAALAYAKSKGYDGVELDYESNNIVAANFKDVADKLRTGLNSWTTTTPRGFLVLAMGNGIYVSDYGVDTLNNNFDQINVMDYDLGEGGYWGYNSALRPGDCWKNIPEGKESWTIEDHGPLQAVQQGVLASKMGLGIAFYGKVYYQDGPSYGPCTERQNWYMPYQTYMDAVDTMKQYPNSYYYDPVAESPYLLINDPTNGHEMISFDDPRSVAAKAAWARSNGIGGVMIYSLSDGVLENNPAGQREPLLDSLWQAYSK